MLELLQQGRSSLVEPQHLYQLCVVSGLILREDAVGYHDSVSIGGGTGGLLTSAASDLREQRSQLLTVALENHLVNLLTGCASHWRDGKYAQADCTPRFLLDWAWSRVTATKRATDRLALPLFDHSRVELSEESRRSMMQASQQLRHLCTLLRQLLRQSEGFGGLLSELETKVEVAALVDQYLRVVLWFFDAGLLPEVPEGPDPHAACESPYPVTQLASVYKTKREKMAGLLEKYPEIDTPCLIVDGLCEELGDDLQVCAVLTYISTTELQ